jgi:hypothetical protein
MPKNLENQLLDKINEKEKETARRILNKNSYSMPKQRERLVMKDKLIYILLTLASVITYGQVNLSLDADKTEYGGKDIVNLTIVLELNGSDLVQQTGFSFRTFQNSILSAVDL